MCYYSEGENAMMLTVKSEQSCGAGSLLPPLCGSGPKVLGFCTCIEQLYLHFILAYFKMLAVTHTHTIHCIDYGIKQKHYGL